ncbi:regulatory particle non-ATPase [Orbilia ellipsospora]|uniref:Regulatory particle non-ATPase n=1 Tax=Orbilia ellipsospora TaxID=2528407 RepID=A0AAV9WRX4_9PEZI
MAEAVLRVLKWRWLAKRVFSSFQQPPPPQPSQPSQPSPSTALTSSPPSSSYWPFGRLFSFKYFKTLPSSGPTKSSSPSSKQEEAPPPEASSSQEPQLHDTPPQATLIEATSSPSPSPVLAIHSPAPSHTTTITTPAAPIPIQLPTPPATPEPAPYSPPPTIASQPPPPPAPPINRQPYLSHLPPLPPIKMSDISTLHAKLVSSFTARTHTTTLPLLTAAKLSLLKSSALIPSPSTPPQLLSQARDILEIGALTSIYLSDTESFNRYYNYLQPFYKISSLQPSQQEAKILGLYLLFLLSQGDAGGFHTALEVLNQEGKGDSESGWQWGEYVRYPVTLERWLMEGSYDKVWEATRKSKTPTEEFDVFTKILVMTLRQEIATSARRAYPSLPISNAKNLLFLDTEKEVLAFAKQSNWEIRDGRIYFPPEDEYDTGDIPDTASVAAAKSAVHSGTIIENTIGYANELEQIV